MAEHNWTPNDGYDRQQPRPLPDGYAINGFEQLPGESGDAYRRYCLYRDLTADRTLAAVAAHEGVSDATVWMMSQRERWKERVAHFDHFMVEEEQDAIRRQMEKRAGELELRRAAIQQSEWEMYQKLHKKGMAMLEWPLARTEVSRDGKNITYIPAKWSQYSAVQILELASQLARRSTEMPTTYTQIDLMASTQQEISTATMTSEERERHEKAMQLAGDMYQRIMAGEDAPALTARIVEPEAEPEPPAWYRPLEELTNVDEQPPEPDEPPLA